MFMHSHDDLNLVEGMLSSYCFKPVSNYLHLMMKYKHLRDMLYFMSIDKNGRTTVAYVFKYCFDFISVNGLVKSH